jgi:hypothetical protein
VTGSASAAKRCRVAAAAAMLPFASSSASARPAAAAASASRPAGGLAAGAVGAADVSLLCYPIYYCLVNGAIALLIHHRRAVLCAAPALASGRA